MTAQALRVAEAPAPYLVAPLPTDHLDTFASAPEGFKRLRELVLNLAVRGRLAKGSDSADWQECTLGDVGEWGSGGTPIKTHPEYYGGDIPWLVIGDLTDGPVFSATTHISAAGLANSSTKMVPVDTLLIAMYGSIGKLGIAKIECATNQAIAYCIPNKNMVLLGFLFNYLLAIRGDLTDRGQGLAQQNISQKILKAFPIKLPPLAEQSRIVAKVEELMALIDALEAKVGAGETARGKLLDTLLAALAGSPDAAATADAWAQLAPHFDLLLQTPADVDRLQQTLLALAVKGRLVPQDPKDEPTVELLKRIRAEKERLIAEGKIKRDKPLPVRDDVESPFAVPLGWQWASLGDVVFSSEAGWSPSCENMPRESGKWGVLKVSAVSWGEFLDEENKALPGHLKARPEYEVQPSDFLLSRANTAELVARSVVAWNPKPRLMLSDKIIRLCTASAVEKAYLNLFNNSSFARAHYVANASGTSASMKNVSREVVLSLAVPVPPAAEQSRIVAAVASLTVLCDRLRERLTARRELAAKLATALTESGLQ